MIKKAPSTERRSFFILDAKYYNISVNGNGITGQPGVEDIVKEFAYRLAFSQFINEESFDKVVNAFLIPRSAPFDPQSPLISNIGKVDLSFLQYFGLGALEE